MRLTAALIIVSIVCSIAARAATCASLTGANKRQMRWKVDRYIYDASLRRDWKVLVNCDHPEVPARIELVPLGEQKQSIKKEVSKAQGVGSESANPDRAQGVAPPNCVKAGEDVEVSNGSRAPVRISMRGVAMQTAFPGQKIRIRLSANGKFVSAIVSGSHSVQLVNGSPISWRKQ